jgi:hypothetical protein
MTFNHAVVWLDHSRAEVVHFSSTAADSEAIKPKHEHWHPHASNAGAAEHVGYFNDIADALKQSTEVLIVGPAQEKLAFAKHLAATRPDISRKVVGVETVDHPSDGQLLAYARKYFKKADLFL